MAQAKLAAGEGDRQFLETKVTTARFFFTKMLPEAHGLFARIMAGSAPVMALHADAF